MLNFMHKAWTYIGKRILKYCIFFVTAQKAGAKKSYKKLIMPKSRNPTISMICGQLFN